MAHQAGVSAPEESVKAEVIQPATGSEIEPDDLPELERGGGPLLVQTVRAHLARTLAAATRTGDPVAYLGEGTFAVLLPTTDPLAVRVVAERLRLRVASRPLAGRVVTVSVGLAVGTGTEALARADVVLQATPVGMGDDAASPLPLALLDHLPAHAFVFDLVYSPPETALVRAARRGVRVRLLLHRRETRRRRGRARRFECARHDRAAFVRELLRARTRMRALEETALVAELQTWMSMRQM